MRNSRAALNRRAVLRGTGVMLGLPLLEAMLPSGAAAAPVTKRLQVFYFPNGMVMQNFVPKATGAAYEATPILAPLQPHRNRFSVISGLGHKPTDGGAGHGPKCGGYLTAVTVFKTEGYDVRAGVSMDQIVASQIGRESPVSSLELGIDPASYLGSCDTGYSCSYTNTLSWRNATTPLPVTINPRAAFERLFGDGDSLDSASREAMLRQRASILDFVVQDAALMARKVSAADKRKMDEYFDSVRDVEKRIQVAERKSRGVVLPRFQRPAGAPEHFADHARLMIDLQVLAMQADLTRVSTFMIGRELSQRSYPELGVPDAHHAISHHGNDPEKLAQLAKINIHHMEMFAYYLQKMSEAKEPGGGSLLDSTFVLAGGAIGDSNSHDNRHIPVIVAGGMVKGGHHIAMPKGTPFSNVLVSAMNKVGVGETAFGDSTGPLQELDA